MTTTTFPADIDAELDSALLHEAGIPSGIATSDRPTRATAPQPSKIARFLARLERRMARTLAAQRLEQGRKRVPVVPVDARTFTRRDKHEERRAFAASLKDSGLNRAQRRGLARGMTFVAA